MMLAFEYSKIPQEDIFEYEEYVLAHLLKKSGKYEFDRLNLGEDNELIVFKNPDFKEHKWWRDNPLWLAFFTFLLSIISSLLLGKILMPQEKLQVTFQDSINKSILNLNQVHQKKHDTIYVHDSSFKKLIQRK